MPLTTERKETLIIKEKEDTNDFLQHVLEGLNAPDKYLNSKYFYDKKGDELFQPS